MYKKRFYIKLLITAILLFLFFSGPLICNEQAPSETAAKKNVIQVELNNAEIIKTEDVITGIVLGEPKIANTEHIAENQVLIFGRTLGVTNLIIWHGTEEKPYSNPENYLVRVYIPGDMLRQIKGRMVKLVPGTENIAVESAKDGVLLYGDVSDQITMDRIITIVKSFGVSPINMMTLRGTQQVQLEVKIAEITRSGAKQMGLSFLDTNNWTIGVFSAGKVGGSATADSSSSTNATISGVIDNVSGLVDLTVSGAGDNYSSTMGSAIDITSPFSSAFQLVAHSLDDNLLGILSLLKQQGLSRVLASPTLVTMSGQEAEFIVGGEYPYPVQGDSGQTNIEFKKFGVMLRFTPYVTGKESITINVSPEVSSLDFSLTVMSGGVSVPGLRTRGGSTTLQLKDGQTFAMAGLLDEQTRTVISKVPLLGDIPILGALFTNKEFQRSETELVIIVTPRLVRAMNPDEVPILPGEGKMDNINDLDFFLMNRVSNPEKTESRSDRKKTIRPEFSGETGFSR